MKQWLEGLPVIGTALAVQERYTADAADPLAAAIAFFGFLSLFPLLLLAVSFAGFVLDDPDEQLAVAERITEAIPGFDQTVEGDEESQVEALLSSVVEQRGTVGAVGLVILLFSGLRVVNAAMVATRVVFRGAVLKGVGAKLRQLVALFGLGGLFLLSATASSLAGTGLGQLPAAVAVVLSLSFSLLFDIGLFLGAYTLLAPNAPLSVRARLPGALFAAVGWTALKVAGAGWVGSQVDNANALYGALGSVIALMLLFYLAGRLYLYGAELTAVRHERGHGPLVAAPAAAAPVPPADEDGPPPPPRVAQLDRPQDPRPAGRAATISPATRARLGADAGPGGAGQQGAAVREADGHMPTGVDDRGRDVRTAVSFALAAGALAAGWRLLGGRQD